jgi:hypothetical protein
MPSSATRERGTPTFAHLFALSTPTSSEAAVACRLALRRRPSMPDHTFMKKEPAADISIPSHQSETVVESPGRLPAGKGPQ